ncbi:hypothetical protein [Cuneatibacter caecimuris]|nr:hypothetical protein [Cuneatibacter caecimuris]
MTWFKELYGRLYFAALKIHSAYADRAEKCVNEFLFQPDKKK